MHKIKLLLLIKFIIVAFCYKASCEVRLPSILSDNMVLQQNSNVKIWGWSEPGEDVVVSVGWDTVKYRSKGDESARWSVMIKTPSAGGPYIITIRASNLVILKNILLGEVWICSGQSNMERNARHGLRQSFDAMKETTVSTIRLLNLPKSASDFPQDDIQATWTECSPETIKFFSAVGYFFSQKLNKELNVPIGIINASWGGTPAETWTPESLVLQDPVLKEAVSAKTASLPLWPMKPGVTFNGMIHPLKNHSIAGVIWYQGESNTKTWSSYGKLFSILIDSWRSMWQSDFPFYYVQIAPYSRYEKSIGVLLREAQTEMSTYLKTGMVVISDLVDNINDIHPANKKDVGLRLANYALAEKYQLPIKYYKSPSYDQLKIEGNKIRIYLKNVGDGLESRSGGTSNFMIAGEDQKFEIGKYKIEGNTIVVWSEAIKKPVAVRYGFQNDALPTIFSSTGLPVNIFRTDKWKME